MKPIAIVTPWFGKDLKGGAEQVAWQLATRLADRGHKVEVLTTCCRSFLEDWSTNHLKSGKHIENNLIIRRFRVNRRRRDEFNTANVHLLAVPRELLKPDNDPVPIEIASTFVNENINSKALQKYLKRHRHDYQAFIFLPYLYGVILHGLSIVAENAYLQPCLHDEAYAYLPAVAQLFRRSKGIFYNSEGEELLAHWLYGPGIAPKGVVVGVGVEVNLQEISQLPEVVDSFDVQHEKYVLYLGRRDATKNTDMLVRAYDSFRKQHPASILRLVLAGPGNSSFGNLHPGVLDLGLVSEPTKQALLAGCLALFQPSKNESFSRVIMEAWLNQRPAAAHRNCLATCQAIETANGGWLAETEEEWAATFAIVDQTDKNELAATGARGQSYAKKYAVWDTVLDRYEQALGLAGENEKSKNFGKTKLKEINQMTPGFAYGDAISNHAIAIRDHLRRLGYRSRIFVQFLDPKVSREAENHKPESLKNNAGLIYHHSIGSNLTQYAIRHTGTKYLIYHNITPADFVRPYDHEFAEILEEGRADLNRLALHFPFSVGDSRYNASELANCGFNDPGVLPICINPEKWNKDPDRDVISQLQDGKANLLFVGRLIPNKCPDHLIEAFLHYLEIDPNARLIIVGGFDPHSAYYVHILRTIEKLGLNPNVILTGKVSDRQLQAYYRTAHLYWSMSEHEGFGVPLIEAMWFDVPVLAYKSTAVPETLGNAGILFTSKDDLVKVAAMAKILVRDDDLRAKVLRAQRKRRLDFLPQAVLPELEKMIAVMEKAS